MLDKNFLLNNNKYKSKIVKKMLVNIVGGPKEISIEVEPTDTIKKLKDKIFARMKELNLVLKKNTNSSGMIISYCGKILKDEETIKGRGIENEDNITINAAYFAA